MNGDLLTIKCVTVDQSRDVHCKSSLFIAHFTIQSVSKLYRETKSLFQE